MRLEVTGGAGTRAVAVIVWALIVSAVACASAQADAWRPSFDLPGPANRSAGFDVAAGPDGTVIAVWTKTTEAKSQVMASVRPPGGAFGTPEPLGAPSGGFPRIAMDGSGNAIVVWAQNQGVSPLLTVMQSTRPAGGSFIAPQPLSSASDEADSPQVAMNSRGDTLVTWVNESDGSVEARGRPAGGSFGAITRMSNDPTPSEVLARAAVGENRSGMVVWKQDNDILRARAWSAATNSFGPATSAFDVFGALASEIGDSPDVAITPTGEAVFVFLGSVSGQLAIRTRTRLSGGTLSPTGTIAGLLSGAVPTLVSNGAGDMLAAWRAGTQARGSFRPAGEGFGSSVALSGAAAVTSSTPATAITPGGDFVAAWLVGSAGSKRVQARVKPRSSALLPLQDDFPVRQDLSAVAAFADGQGDMGTLSRRVTPSAPPQPSDPGTLELRPFDTAPPRPVRLALPVGSVAGRPAAFSASFLDTWSPFSVSWTFGDGGTAPGAAVQHVYGRAGTFTANATALDAAGNAASQSGAVGVRALRPDEIDADRDGFTADKDCDDANPAIRPGTPEIRGNAVDENCDRITEPFPRVAANASLVVLFGRAFLKIKTLTVRGLEPGDEVRLSCKGPGCKRSLNGKIRIERKTRELRLTKRAKGVRLRKGARVQVRVSQPGFVARIFRFTVKRLNDVPVRKELCQAPGAERPGRC